MIRVVKSHIFYATFAVLALYAPLAYFIPQDDFYIFMGAMSICGASSVLHAYWPALVLAIRMSRTDVDYVDFLTLGVMGVWAAVDCRIVYLTYIRYMYGPMKYDTIFLTFTQYMIFVSSLCFLSARRVVRNQVPHSSTPRIVWTVGVGLAIGTVLCLTN